jgi:hypothetical protein
MVVSPEYSVAPVLHAYTERRIIAEELGEDVSTVFEFVKPDPVASASIGQVQPCFCGADYEYYSLLA